MRISTDARRWLQMEREVINKTTYFGAFCLWAGLYGCAGYVPGNKADWDARIRQMCERDGGVTVYERVELTREEFKRLRGVELALPLPVEADGANDSPYFQRRIETKLNESNPEVIRAETQVIRQSDGKLLGRSIRYWRRGGDFPTGIAHDTSFICPERADLTPQIFIVKEGR
jgi:hypothetical protein